MGTIVEWSVVGQGMNWEREKRAFDEAFEAGIEHISGRGDSATVQLNVRLNLFPGTFQTRLNVPLGKTAVLGNVHGGRAGTAVILTVRPELVSASP